MADGRMIEAVQGSIRAPTDNEVGQGGEIKSPPASGKSEVVHAPENSDGWRDYLSVTADFLGIGGAVFAVFTFFMVKTLRRETLSRIRLPSHIRTLRKYASELSSTLGDLKNNGQAIISTVAQLDSTLSEIASITSGEAQTKAKSLRLRANIFATSQSGNNRDGWQVHADINGLIVALENVVANEQVVPRS